MNKAKEIFDQWKMQREQIEQEAKENGIWQYSGLDSNNYLFKDVDKAAKEKLKALQNEKDHA